MATPVGRIEKEFLFKAIYDERLPVMYIKDGNEYAFTLECPAGEELIFNSDKPLAKIKNNSRLPLLFNYRGQVIDFTIDILTVKDDSITCKIPDILYKNLDRNFLRVGAPSDMKILFTFCGDRYNLAFPRVMEYEQITNEDMARNMDPHNLSGLMKQIKSLLSKFADGYRIINFKDKKPETTEERIVSETGKALFIPSTADFIPKVDPYPKKRIITEELFKRYLESTGIGTIYLDDNCARFLKYKFDNGIYSDAWVPILFHEYVIGYIHIWIDKQGRLPFDFSVLDHVYQYAKILAFALKENGYFEHGKVENEPFAGRVLDISASGLLFACPLGTVLLSTILIDSELTVIIETPNRTINVIAKIVRRFKDKSAGYFGCRFMNIEPEDTRFLFEHLYGRQIDAADTAFLAGQV
ncbi:MAG: PilZ domain-containing protein [Treponema sp.]|nr:PilZ domain-containing protein [Treponema sp.]